VTAGSALESHIRHGSKVGRFVVVGELGKGGMGVVYAAHDRELDRQVALKVMRIASVEEIDRVRMLREGQAMARITHPNVITVFEVGSDDGVVFLAQELLDGGTLGEWLEKPHSQEAILDKFVAAGRGLAAAHAVGLVHRDFKPENVLLGKDGRVRVADFGLAREVGATEAALMATAPGGGPPPDLADMDSGALARNLTRTGVVMGTPMFMAPEQHEGKTADARSDQFAFCVALYQALYNDWPFDGKTAVALADNVINGQRKAPPAVKVPAHVRSAISRGLSTNAAERFPSMEALLVELQKRPASAKKPLMVIAGILVVGAGAAASIAILGDRGSSTTTPQAAIASGSAEPAPKPVSTENRDVDPRALTSALDHGRLDDATKKYLDDALLSADPVKAASAKAVSALMLVLRGDVPGAEAKWKEADAEKGTDPAAVGYTEMAAGSIAWAKGDLVTAIERSEHCVRSLAAVPVAASICHQIHGDAEADRGNAAAARAAYATGLSLAEQAGDPQRIAELQLAIAQLDFDAKQEDVSLDAITKLQKDARRRGAVSCEATAAVLASRIKLAKADPQGALDVFDDVNPDVLQAYRTKMIAKLTLGQLYGYRQEADEDGVVGLDRIDAVIADAKKKGFVGLELEARLGRVLVKVITGAEDAEAERAKLVADATAKSYGRIAKLAANFNRDPLPAETPPPE
jgi:serine/threonine protein kinase